MECPKCGEAEKRGREKVIEWVEAHSTVAKCLADEPLFLAYRWLDEAEWLDFLNKELTKAAPTEETE